MVSPEKFIGTNLRVKMVDGRVLDGILTVVDPFGNLLLSNVWETAQDLLVPSELKRRELGLVSVPRQRVVQILLDKRQESVLRL